jgi:DNA-binding transcriptional MerR regulator
MAKPTEQITLGFVRDEKTASSTVPVITAEEKLMNKRKEIIQKANLPVEEKKVKPASTPAVLAGKRGRRSLKDIDPDADLIRIPEDEILFQKQYYSIGEVAVMFRVNQSLVRYWETEFDILKPKKNRKGDRFFRPVDVKNLVLIYDLLRKRKFTIEGAKDYLKKNKNAAGKFAVIKSLESLKAFLLELKENL